MSVFSNQNENEKNKPMPDNTEISNRLTRVETLLEGRLMSLEQSINKLTDKIEDLDINKERINKLNEWKDKHEQSDDVMHKGVDKHMTTINAYIKIGVGLLAPLYAQFVYFLFNLFNR